MPGTNNFQQWNPSAVNQESDSAYTSDSLRSGGAASGAVFPSATANKLFFQLSTMVTALAQMLANKSYNISDANLTNLITALTNIVTNHDVPGYLVRWSEVPGVFVRFSDYAQVFGIPGYSRMPNQMIMQWGQTAAFDTGPLTVTFPIPFPSQCLNVQATQNFDLGTTTRMWSVGVLAVANCQIRNDGLGACRWLAVGY